MSAIRDLLLAEVEDAWRTYGPEPARRPLTALERTNRILLANIALLLILIALTALLVALR